MAKQDQFLSTAEFASKAGLSTSSVTKLIRDGKIKAKKKSGKWMIAPDQLKAQTLKDLSKPGKNIAGKKAVRPATKKATAKQVTPANREKPADAKPTKAKMYTVAEFANITYLTEFGVKEWLKQGRLSGKLDPGGQWKIDAANLEAAAVKRLVR